MVAALYSSRDSGTKDFVNDCGVHFGWGTVEDVFRADLVRAKKIIIHSINYLCNKVF